MNSNNSSTKFNECISEAIGTSETKQSCSNFTQYVDVETKSHITEYIGEIADIKSRPSLGNMTEYIGDVSNDEGRDDAASEGERKAPLSAIHAQDSVPKDNGNWFRGLTKSFEEEGIIGFSFGIVNAVTSTAFNVVAGTASNVGHMLTNHEHDEQQLSKKDKYAPNPEHKGPAVLQFASYIADVVLSTVSPVLDLHFFGYSPNPKADIQLSVYWDSPSVKKAIGYDNESCSFMGTESVYFDTRSVGFFSAMTGDERSVAESMITDDFQSCVSREEALEMEIEFV